jgi:FecR protein
MSMKDDYLWDRSGPPDADLQRLEQLLGRLQSVPPVPRLPDAAVRWHRLRTFAPVLAAAAAVVLMVAGTWLSTRQPAAWEVASLSGQPRVGSAIIAGRGRLAVGETLVTDGASQARMNVATIGEVTADINTRVRLVATRDGHHRLALEHGTLHAVISAPPGQFIVSTPSATATDLGCAYTLHVDEDGAGLLTVTAGWVALALNGRESLVPAGASSRTHPTLGPGTPSYEDAGDAFRAALDELDFGTDRERRAGALRLVLARADAGHAVTLWHLIKRVDAADRGSLVDALADQVAMPPGVTREAVLNLDDGALDLWWNTLGLGEAGWWRKFSAPLPAGPR